jgi:hypothetical protein
MEPSLHDWSLQTAWHSNILGHVMMSEVRQSIPHLLKKSPHAWHDDIAAVVWMACVASVVSIEGSVSSAWRLNFGKVSDFLGNSMYPPRGGVAHDTTDLVVDTCSWKVTDIPSTVVNPDATFSATKLCRIVNILYPSSEVKLTSVSGSVHKRNSPQCRAPCTSDGHKAF